MDEGEPLAVFHSDGDKDKIKPAKDRFLNAYTIGNNKVEPPRFFYARVSREGVEEIS